jgi:phage baseplate assembly protein W
MAIKSKSFRDFSLTFEKNAVTNDILSLKNEDAIKASVKNIVLYNFFEKPFDPAFGGNIIGLLFENYTTGLATEIEARIRDAIDIYEPRVAVIRVDAIFTEDRNDMQVKVKYVILGVPPTVDNVRLVFKP